MKNTFKDGDYMTIDSLGTANRKIWHIFNVRVNEYNLEQDAAPLNSNDINNPGHSYGLTYCQHPTREELKAKRVKLDEIINDYSIY